MKPNKLTRIALPALVLAGLGSLQASSAFAALPAQEATTTEPTRALLVVLAVSMVAIAVQLLIEVVWNYLEWFLMNVRGWKASDIKSPQYQQFKSGTSLLIGAVLGVLIASATGMRLFQYFEPLLPDFVSSVPAGVDVLLTGLLIGAVTKPVHDLFSLLAKTKEFMGSSAIRQRELASDALASGVLKLAQSEAQALVDVPGIGPARLPVPGSLADDEPGSDRSPTERYVDLLHNRTMM
ncbi:MAG: hypothetical protein ACRC1H_20030 [Caldilineaceae bacterium]